MPKLDGTGPKGTGSEEGRKLGNCSTATDEEKLNKLGVGKGGRRKSGAGTGTGAGVGAGKGRRLKSGDKE